MDQETICSLKARERRSDASEQGDLLFAEINQHKRSVKRKFYIRLNQKMKKRMKFQAERFLKFKKKIIGWVIFDC